MSKPGLLNACSTGLRPSARSRRQHEVDAAALDLLGLHGVHRRVGGQVCLHHAASGSTSAAVTTRGGLVCISELLVEQRQPLAQPAVEVGGLAA